MSLRNYSSHDYYNQGWAGYKSTDFIVGRHTELWIAPTRTPSLSFITTDGCSRGDTSMTVTSDRTVTLYRGDVLNYDDGLIVVSSNTKLLESIPTVLPIVDSPFNVSAAQIACTYGLFPVMSITDGGGLQMEAEEATALNKIQLYETKGVTKRTAYVEISGRIIKHDESIAVLSRLQTGNKPIYCEIRYSPFAFEGQTPIGSYRLEATLSLSFDFTRMGFSGASARLGIIGQPVPYNPNPCLVIPQFGTEFANPAPPQTSFPTIMKLSVDTSLNPSGTDFSFDVTGSQDAYIFWGDGSFDRILSDTDTGLSHTYSSNNLYEIIVAGTAFNGVTFANVGVSKRSVTRISEWDASRFTLGDSAFRNMVNLRNVPNGYTPSRTDLTEFFRGCTDFVSGVATWDVSGVTDFTGMFRDCTSFNENIGSWNVSSAVSFENLFRNCSSFNQDLNSWDTSSVVDMYAVFSGCTSFNQPLSNWNVANVQTLELAFNTCINFNQNLNSWVTTSLTSLNRTFKECASFNQPLSNWDVSNVTDFQDLFLDCTSFNQDISGWDVSSGLNFIGVFNSCTSFNQPLTNWFLTPYATNLTAFLDNTTSFNQDISHFRVDNVTTMERMLNLSGLSVANYSNLLIAWAALSVQPFVDLDAGGLRYNAAGSTARDELTGVDGWVITDSGQV